MAVKLSSSMLIRKLVDLIRLLYRAGELPWETFTFRTRGNFVCGGHPAFPGNVWAIADLSYVS